MALSQEDLQNYNQELLKVMDKWTEILDRGGNRWSLHALGFMKTFHTVPHERLLKKIIMASLTPSWNGLGTA